MSPSNIGQPYNTSSVVDGMYVKRCTFPICNMEIRSVQDCYSQIRNTNVFFYGPERYRNNTQRHERAQRRCLLCGVELRGVMEIGLKFLFTALTFRCLLLQSSVWGLTFSSFGGCVMSALSVASGCSAVFWSKPAPQWSHWSESHSQSPMNPTRPQGTIITLMCKYLNESMK